MRYKPKWTTRKYMGDDKQSWAVIDSKYLPKGHKGVVFDYLPDGAVYVCGLDRAQASYYCKLAKEKHT